MTLKDKASLTRQLSALNMLAEIQQKMVAMEVNGFSNEPWFPGSIVGAMENLDEAIDAFGEEGKKIHAEAQAKANGGVL